MQLGHYPVLGRVQNVFKTFLDFFVVAETFDDRFYLFQYPWLEVVRPFVDVVLFAEPLKGVEARALRWFDKLTNRKLRDRK